jgi:hypothetical protein
VRLVEEGKPPKHSWGGDGAYWAQRIVYAAAVLQHQMRFRFRVLSRGPDRGGYRTTTVSPPKLMLQPEAICSAWQPLMQQSNEREEHFTRDVAVDVAVLFEAYRLLLLSGCRLWNRVEHRKHAIHEVRNLLLLRHLISVVDPAALLQGVHAFTLLVEEAGAITLLLVLLLFPDAKRLTLVLELADLLL